jgi:signal transduction histidine kinase
MSTPYMAALHEVSAYLQNNDDVRGSLKLILDLAVRNTGADYGYLLLREADDPTFQVIVAQDKDGNSRAGGLDSGARSLLDRAMKTGHSVIVVDSSAGERFAGLPVEESFAVAYLVVPMLLASRPAGLICLAGNTANQFGEEHQAFVELLSTQAALVVERDRQAQIIHRVEDAQSEFISLTSHQLRVPLTAMSGYTDMILNGMVGPLSERQESFLRIIRRNVDRMRILIDTLGEMNRIDGGRRTFTLRAFDLTVILEGAILALEKDVAGRHQELVVDVDPSLPFIQTDRPAVLSVLTVIIDNASRYSPDEAIISVQVSYSGEMARLEIVDVGAGISIEDQSQLFTPFFRSDDPIIREHIGWGLALAHGKKVIEALGGTIGFNSTLGDGSIFFFTIPLAAAVANSG